MTRVLVVHHDLDLADQEVDSLRRRGYEVTQCAGPIGAWAGCPVIAGRTCGLADDADVLVYDAWADSEPDGAQRLIEGMREVHPDTPIVLVATSLEPSWVETAGIHGVTPLVGSPTGDRLAEAIEAALGSRRADEPTAPAAG
jgi:hypothetical protein